MKKVFEAKYATPEEGVITGYASMFDVVDSYSDSVQKGAFARDLQTRGNTRPFLADHDPSRSIGLATFYEDAKGLRMTAKLEMGLEDARNTWLRAKAGILSGLSIGFQTITEKHSRGIRLLTEIELWETSAVVFPALRVAQIDGVKTDDPLSNLVDTLAATNRALRADADRRDDGGARTAEELLTGLRAFRTRI